MAIHDANRIPISAALLFDTTKLLHLRQSLVEQSEQNRKTIETIDQILNQNQDPNQDSMSITIPSPKQPTYLSFPTQPNRYKILILVLEAHERLNLRWVTTEHPFAISRNELAEKLSNVVGWTVTESGVTKAINNVQKELQEDRKDIKDAIENIEKILKKTYGISD